MKRIASLQHTLSACNGQIWNLILYFEYGLQIRKLKKGLATKPCDFLNVQFSFEGLQHFIIFKILNFKDI